MAYFDLKENKSIFYNLILYIVTFLILVVFLCFPIFEINNNDSIQSLLQMMISNLSHLSVSSFIGWLIYAFIPLTLLIVSFLYFIASIAFLFQKNAKINLSQYFFFQITYLVLLIDIVLIAFLYFLSAMHRLPYIIFLLLLLLGLICHFSHLNKEIHLYCKEKEQRQKKIANNKIFIIHTILSLLFSLSLLIFLAITNMETGDGKYCWLSIVLTSISPYALFDNATYAFSSPFASLFLFATIFIVILDILRLIAWCFTRKQQSLSTLFFFQINFIICAGLYLILDLNIPSQDRIITNLSLYMVLPALIFGAYYFIYTIVLAKKQNRIIASKDNI